MAKFGKAVVDDSGVSVHCLPGTFNRRDLAIMDRDLCRLPKPCRLLVQYVPHAFGCKGMNVPFCWWLSRRPEPVWVMFHEVVYPLSSRQPVLHNVLGVITRVMATLVARKAERIFVSIPAWQAYLPASAKRRATWMPVPSNTATSVQAEEVAKVRARIATIDEIVLGHFGTYGSHVAPLLEAILPSLLHADSRRKVLLIGKGSDAFAARLSLMHPELGRRITATGELDGIQIAPTLAACDLLVQPFPDGVSSRRTSLMAGLALGLPIVTNAGPLTDSLWRERRAVDLTPSPSAADFIAASEKLLAEPTHLSELGRRAREVYQRHFALSRSIEALRTGMADHRIAA
jgi:glycosyltransferase involved in cell wall biosynthesis